MKRDIDDLISEFTAADSTRFGDMKELWLSKKFSYIFESRPTCSTSLALFMQSLYSHSISHFISSSSSLSRSLAGLYCLYCLHETQPFNPPFKVYISLQELRYLRRLLADARVRDVRTARVVVRRMLEKNVFLFGSVETNEGLKGKVDELTELEGARIRAACERLFGDGKVEEFVHMDMGVEVDLGKVKQMCGEYAELKSVAGGGDEEMKKGRSEELVGGVMEKIVEEWDEQRDVFYRQTGLSQKQLSEQEQQHREEEDDGFDKELEQMLFEAS